MPLFFVGICMAGEEISSTNFLDMSFEELSTLEVKVGTRSASHSVNESPVPIDVIQGEEFINQGNTDMLNQLKVLVPSYNVFDHPISDAATIVRPANLRGLPPDSILVLVNGKRRHRSAVITFIPSGGLSNGSQGPDLNVIPSIALDRLEILRDGASAQYGSDAIAGVFNFILKNANSGSYYELRQGSYFEGDGETSQFSANIGLPFTEEGFANFSFEYKQADSTDRSVQRNDAAALIAAGNTAVADPAQIWGLPEIKSNLKSFANFGLNLSEQNDFYMFFNAAKREIEGGFYFRNPNTRGGLYSADGGNTLLVGDLTPNEGSIAPTIPVVRNVPDPTGFDIVSQDPNLFIFNELFPGGFTPRFGGTVIDGSIVMGIKGNLDNEINFDLSASVGRNEIEFFIKNTVNASMGPSTPTKFTPGQYVEIEKGFNLDIVKRIEMDFTTNPVNIAGGLEYREDTFEIYNGDKNSFMIGQLASQGFSIGSNGFPGFKPEDSGSFNRFNWAGYMDVEFPFTSNFLLGVASRFEDFEDFGNTSNGKLAAFWKFSENLSIRGASSTGFRAPTVGQSNVRNVATDFTSAGLVDQATLPPTNPISIQKGGKALEPEESIHFSTGLVMEFDKFFLTADYYRVEVTDRIGQTSALSLTSDDKAALLAQGIADASSFTSVRFFANAFDTTTQGIDLVACSQVEWDAGTTRFSLALNWNETEVDEYNPLVISNMRVRQLEEALPEIKGSLTINHSKESWRTLLRLGYYGSFWEAHLDESSLPVDVESAWIVDAEFCYKFNNSFNFVVGAQNFFNEYPDKHEWAGIAGNPYPVNTAYGFSGGFYYIRLNYYR
ncbi:TonB-dependent receptor [bacterium B13(2017)]|nr:TonB-dependent receptor [bacterium B13(2017)]